MHSASVNLLHGCDLPLSDSACRSDLHESSANCLSRRLRVLVFIAGATCLPSLSVAAKGPFLVARPACAAPGDTVRMKGSGWPRFPNGWHYVIQWRLAVNDPYYEANNLLDEDGEHVPFRFDSTVFVSDFADSSWS